MPQTTKRPSRLIETLESGKTAIGTFISIGSYDEITAVSDNDYDFVILEMEHWGFDFATLQHSLYRMLHRRRIAERDGTQAHVVPLVRIAPNAGEMNQWIPKQVLDAGAYGIVAPHVTTVENARAIVGAMRYPHPRDPTNDTGVRGWHPSAAPRYWGLPMEEYFSKADLWPLNPQGNMFLMAIIEDREGVENLPQILEQVKGISAVWAGVGDLSVSLGYPGQLGHPEVEKNALQILAACRAHNVPCMIPANASTIKQRIEQGFRMILEVPFRHGYATLAQTIGQA